MIWCEIPRCNQPAAVCRKAGPVILYMCEGHDAARAEL